MAPSPYLQKLGTKLALSMMLQQCHVSHRGKAMQSSKRAKLVSHFPWVCIRARCSQKHHLTVSFAKVNALCFFLLFYIKHRNRHQWGK